MVCCVDVGVVRTCARTHSIEEALWLCCNVTACMSCRHWPVVAYADMMIRTDIFGQRVCFTLHFSLSATALHRATLVA